MNHDYDNGDEFEAARYGLELPKKVPGQTITIIEDNPDHVDRPELDSQIQSLTTSEVWIGGTVWQPENLMDLVKRDYVGWIK